jgi:hypothetical protein
VDAERLVATVNQPQKEHGLLKLVRNGEYCDTNLGDGLPGLRRSNRTPRCRSSALPFVLVIRPELLISDGSSLSRVRSVS